MVTNGTQQQIGDSEAMREGLSEMAHQVHAFATETEDFVLIPKTHMVEGENQFLQVNLHQWVMAQCPPLNN